MSHDRVQYYMYMSKDQAERYREALNSLNLADVSRATGRHYRTLHSYLRGERRITDVAVTELIKYLRARSAEFTAAADQLAEAFDQGERDGS